MIFVLGLYIACPACCGVISESGPCILLPEEPPEEPEIDRVMVNHSIHYGRVPKESVNSILENRYDQIKAGESGCLAPQSVDQRALTA